MGPYVLLEEIGRGGQGIVYRAWHRETGEILAVKTVLPQEANFPESLIRFQREVAAAQRLDHPHVMPVREVGCTTDGVPFFSMEFASGGSLHNLVAKYRGRWRQIAELMVKISEAVHHAHGRGILHRDLKPGNILFTENYEPMVTDFGLAKQLVGSDDLTKSCAVLGTPSYVSPEQAAGKTKELTPASDVYSLGAILYELLTGRPPFVGNNPLDVLQQVASQSPKRPRRLVRSVPNALDAICMRCLELTPEDRYHSTQALTADLGSWLNGGKITRPSIFARARRLASQHASILGWSFGSVGLVCIVWLAWLNARESGRLLAEPTTVAVAVEELDQRDVPKLAARQATDAFTHVISKSGTFRLRDGDMARAHSLAEVFDPVAYGRATATQVVLTGWIRCAGTQMRLMMQLMRCDTGEVVWRHTDTFPSDRAATDLPRLARIHIPELEKKWLRNSRASTRAFRHIGLTDATTYYAKGVELVAHTNRRDLKEAISLFRRASEKDPNFAAPRAMLAAALWQQADTYGEIDNVPEAMSVAREALALEPDSALAHRVIGSCYSRVGRCVDALEEFWRAVEIDTRSAGSCMSLGLCLRGLGQAEEAIPWLTRAVQLEPTHFAFSGTLAETLIFCGHDHEAEGILNNAVDLDKNQPELQFNIVALRTWQRDYDDARQLCAQTRLRFSDYRFGLSLAAWVEFCDGKRAEAERAFEQLRSENTYQQNWECYGAINPSSALAYLAQQRGAGDHAHLLATEASEMDQALLSRFPRNPRILHDLAATCAVVGEKERALRFLEESVASGWIELRSTEIDPRFSTVSEMPRFKMLVRHSSSGLQQK